MTGIRGKTGGEMILNWTSNGQPWSFTGRLAGERLVALVRYGGIDYPAVLERAAARNEP